jgi:hypothetical protein
MRFFRPLAGRQNDYRLLQRFNYTLPGFLPDVSPPFLKPIIQVYSAILTHN